MPLLPESPIQQTKNKQRADQLLVGLGLCDSRAQAQGLILAGKVFIAGKRVEKPGSLVQALAEEIRIDRPLQYVSRGALKLVHVLDTFHIPVEGLVAMDVGASTGGFTDCLLQRGTKQVYAIDVGYGQLAWRLRNHPQVVVMERTNIRHLPAETLNPPGELAVVDVSFISLKKVLPVVACHPHMQTMLALLKPQFEYLDYCKPKGFTGVVQSESDRALIVEGVLKDLSTLLPEGWVLKGQVPSPITGAEGNQEFLLWFAKI